MPTRGVATICVHNDKGVLISKRTIDLSAAASYRATKPSNEEIFDYAVDVPLGYIWTGRRYEPPGRIARDRLETQPEIVGAILLGIEALAARQPLPQITVDAIARYNNSIDGGGR